MSVDSCGGEVRKRSPNSPGPPETGDNRRAGAGRAEGRWGWELPPPPPTEKGEVRAMGSSRRRSERPGRQRPPAPAPAPPGLPRYAEEVIAAALAGVTRPGFYTVAVRHERGCDSLGGRGPCNCHPEVRAPERWVEPEEN